MMTIAQQFKEQGRVEGEAIGMERGMTIAQQFKEQGRVEGEAIGIERGLEKGKTEAQKIIAMRILHKGLSLATVSQITDLSMEELQTLEEERVH
jgi:predicted transposase YdaD